MLVKGALGPCKTRSMQHMVWSSTKVNVRSISDLKSPNTPSISPSGTICGVSNSVNSGRKISHGLAGGRLVGCWRFWSPCAYQFVYNFILIITRNSVAVCAHAVCTGACRYMVANVQQHVCGGVSVCLSAQVYACVGSGKLVFLLSFIFHNFT